jgi:flagellar biosynthetic protein FliR
MEEFLKLLEIGLQTFEIGMSPQTFLVFFLLIFSRFIAFVYTVPFWGGRAVPKGVKVSLATALVVITFPSVVLEIPPEGVLNDPGPVKFLALIFKELFVGFTLGFAASIIFEAVVVAGRIIDFQRGVNMGELFAPDTFPSVSQISQFKLQLAIVVFLTLGAHRFFISSLISSFEVIPLAGFPQIETGWIPVIGFITGLTAQILLIGLQLAVPAIIALLITDLIFGLINRTVPEIDVFFVSLPVKMVVGIVVILLSFQIIISRYISLFDDSYGAFKFIIDLFSKMYP